MGVERNSVPLRTLQPWLLTSGKGGEKPIGKDWFIKLKEEGRKLI